MTGVQTCALPIALMLCIFISGGGKHQGMSRDRSATFGLMFSVGLGASKELWDSRPEGSGWSWKDFTWDVAGATTGYTVWQLTRH